jgi:hypothetical protein
MDVVKVDLDGTYVIMAIHVCFKYMFQMFYLFQTYVASAHLGVAKIDLDIAFVAMATHICCKCMFQMFHLF